MMKNIISRKKEALIVLSASSVMSMTFSRRTLPFINGASLIILMLARIIIQASRKLPARVETMKISPLTMCPR